jgi:hypothetical protein
MVTVIEHCRVAGHRSSRDSPASARASDRLASGDGQRLRFPLCPAPDKRTSSAGLTKSVKCRHKPDMPLLGSVRLTGRSERIGDLCSVRYRWRGGSSRR